MDFNTASEYIRNCDVGYPDLDIRYHHLHKILYLAESAAIAKSPYKRFNHDFSPYFAISDRFREPICLDILPMDHIPNRTEFLTISENNISKSAETEYIDFIIHSKLFLIDFSILPALNNPMRHCIISFDLMASDYISLLTSEEW